MNMRAESMEYKRAADLETPMAAERDPSNGDVLVGSWVNTNLGNTRGFSRLIIDRAADRFTFRALGIGDDGPIDWGETEAELFANLEEEGVTPSALYAAYDLGYMQVEFQVRANRGVLVVTYFTRFTDGSGRASWVSRSLFRVEAEAVAKP